MSAVDEYKALPLGAGRPMKTIHGLKAIAELEAEIERLTIDVERRERQQQLWLKAEQEWHSWREAAEQAEAELVALNARRCDGCRWYEAGAMDPASCAVLQGFVPHNDFWCCDWKAQP